MWAGCSVQALRPAHIVRVLQFFKYEDEIIITFGVCRHFCVCLCRQWKLFREG